MSFEHLKTLHTALVDTEKGYEEASKDADDPEAMAIFFEMLALRRHDHSEIYATLLKAGEKPSDEGSFMGLIHETVVSVRSAITGLGTNTLGSFIMGEAQIEELYKSAQTEAAGNAPIMGTLSRQAATLHTMIEKMKRFASSYGP